MSSKVFPSSREQEVWKYPVILQTFFLKLQMKFQSYLGLTGLQQASKHMLNSHVIKETPCGVLHPSQKASSSFPGTASFCRASKSFPFFSLIVFTDP